jgi:ammonium transporter, Amt family
MDITALSVSLNTVWLLIASALVFFMQAGFALVEAGFTRTKNTTNILFKNLIDFCIGTIFFWLLGYGIMFGTGNGFLGAVEWFGKVNHGGSLPNEAFLIFQTVFAATAATIVSGAMAERTKFMSYLFYSLAISAIIYPISGHWAWGGGWLSTLKTPFHDFAGSTVVHSVGGWVAFTGAAMLGPRIGKFTNGKANPILGHSITLGTLGVFILWIGWFGFNPGSTLSAGDSNMISHIYVTTNMAAAAGGLATLITTWLRYGKPGLSMSLNGVLAGLVAITAGCDTVTAGGSLVIGLLAGILVVFAVEFFEKVLKIDDPVGAISVHGVCGAFGTLMVGFLAKGNGVTGLIYGGGLNQLITQSIGVVSVMAWTLGTGFALFFLLKSTVGLRVSRIEEENGLDYYEHGETAYNM